MRRARARAQGYRAERRAGRAPPSRPARRGRARAEIFALEVALAARELYRERREGTADTRDSGEGLGERAVGGRRCLCRGVKGER